MFSIAEKFGKENGYNDIYLHTHKTLPGALKFWTKMGFVVRLDEGDELETVHMDKYIKKFKIKIKFIIKIKIKFIIKIKIKFIIKIKIKFIIKIKIKLKIRNYFFYKNQIILFLYIFECVGRHRCTFRIRYQAFPNSLQIPPVHTFHTSYHHKTRFF